MLYTWKRFLVGLLILTLAFSMLALPACDDDDDDDNDTVATNGTAATTDGKTYSLKLAYSTPATSFEGELAEKFAQMLNEYTDGRIEVETYPNAMLYGSGEIMQATQSGANDILFDLTYFFYNRFPYLMISNLIGFWKNAEHCMAFNNHPDVLAKVSAECDKLGLHLFGLPLTGMTMVYSTKDKELKSMKDMDGMSVGTVTGAAVGNALEWSGGRSVQVDITEMQSGFQMKMFDVYPTTLTGASGYKIWDMGAKHILVQPRGANFSALAAMNSSTWKDLSSDIQDIITNQMVPDFMAYCSEAVVNIYKESIATLREHSDTLNIIPDAETDQMLAETTDNAMTKMFIGAAGELYDLADSLRP